MVAKSSGSAITSGTVSYYLKALTGSDVGKWWDDDAGDWAASETPNAMTHQGDGCWTIELSASPFEEDVFYLEYAKESGNLHIAAEGRLLRGQVAVDDVNAVTLPDPSPAGYGGGDITIEDEAIAIEDAS